MVFKEKGNVEDNKFKPPKLNEVKKLRSNRNGTMYKLIMYITFA